MTASDSYDPLAILKAALGEGSPELAAGLMDLFIEDAPARLEALAKALNERDSEALRVAAHNLKGKAQTVGIKSIVTLAERLEDLARTGEWQGTEFLGRRLEDEFRGLCRRLNVTIDESHTTHIRSTHRTHRKKR